MATQQGAPAAAEVLTPKEAAHYLRVAIPTLERWRYVGDVGPRFSKVGRLVRYRRSALDAWLNDRERDCTLGPAA